MAYINSAVIFQFFEIILGLIAIGLESHAYQHDKLWNDRLAKHGQHICEFIRTIIPAKLAEELRVLDNSEDWDNATDDESFDEMFHSLNCSSSDDDDDSFSKHETEDLMRRDSSESAFLLISLFCTVIIAAHLICSCLSKNLTWRYKWNAAVQGSCMFFFLFAAVLLAISANRIDHSYYILAPEEEDCFRVSVCQVLRNSDTGVVTSIDPVPAETKLVLNRVHNLYFDEGICQLFNVKTTASVITCIQALFCIVTICLTLATIDRYDEEQIERWEDDEDVEIASIHKGKGYAGGQLPKRLAKKVSVTDRE